MSWHGYASLQLAQAHFSQPLWTLDAAQRAEVERQLERKLQLEELVLAHALAVDVMPSAAELHAARQSLHERYGSAEAWQAIMAQIGLSESELQQALAHELRVYQVLERVVATVQPISESEARRYYLDHPRQFLRPEQREVRHILLTVDEEQPGCQLEAVRPRLLALQAELADEPHRFGELALRHSECPTALERGRIGYVVPGQLYAELDAVLFALPLGGISAIIQSPMGLHLLQCLDIREAAPIPLEEAVPRIIEQQFVQACAQAQRRWLRSLQRRTQAAMPPH